MFLLFARSIGTHPKGRGGGCSQVAAWPRCQEKKFLERDPEPARGEESETRRARYASSEHRAEGRSSCTEAVAEWTCKKEIVQSECQPIQPEPTSVGQMTVDSTVAVLGFEIAVGEQRNFPEQRAFIQE